MAQSILYTIYGRLAKYARQCYVHQVIAEIEGAYLDNFKYEKHIEYKNNNWEEVSVKASCMIRISGEQYVLREEYIDRFSIDLSTYNFKWCQAFVENNFGRDKLVKTCNVKKELILEGKKVRKHTTIESFQTWFQENVYPDYRAEISEVLNTVTARMINEFKLRISQSEELRHQTLANLATEEVKKVMMKYKSVPEDVIRCALVECALHSVLDF